MKKIITIILLLLTLPFAVAATWSPSESNSINQGLYNGYEPSGIVYHPTHDALFLVGDDGDFTKMNLDGSNAATTRIGGDLEGATYLPGSNNIYVLVERPFTILEVDPIDASIVSRISLVGVVPAVNNPKLGLEGIAFVPNGAHPYQNSLNGGLFYIGVQEGGWVHVVDVNLEDASAALIDSFKPVENRGDVSGLHYSYETNHLYVLYDGANKIRVITTDNVFVEEYNAPGSNQEGITFSSICSQVQTFIAEDSGDVLRYGGFDVSCPVVESQENEAQEQQEESLISSIVRSRDGIVTVHYENDEQYTFDPFEGTKRVKAKMNSQKTRVIVTDGQFVSLYDKDQLLDQVQVHQEPVRRGLRIKEKADYDLVKVILRYDGLREKVKIKLQDDRFTVIS